MPTPAIRVENLGKRYRLGATHSQTLGELLSSAANRLFGRRNGHAPAPKLTGNSSSQMDEEGYFWALKDVSFDVQPGEVVGIIGRNGAGKSTLLKILSNIVSPTTGHVELHGRVASLLEVGTGFHPELTGRENVYLNGAILGMAKTEVRRKFDEIVAFAEIDQFIDTPVKRYSSGMYVRLAFAVAAHLDPEILILDEVLAVGDASFQKKCLGKMNSAAREGRTVLFVSHNMTAIQTLCQRAIWIDHGRVHQDGEVASVVSSYLSTNATEVLEQTWNDPQTAPGNEHIRLRRVQVVPSTRETISVLTPFRIEFEVWNLRPGARLNFSMHLFNSEEICVLNDGSDSIECAVGIMRAQCCIPGNFLNDGTYSVRLMVVRDSSYPIFDAPNAATFEVHDAERTGTNWYGKWQGVVRPHFDWDVETIAAADTAVANVDR